VVTEMLGDDTNYFGRLSDVLCSQSNGHGRGWHHLGSGDTLPGEICRA
jgi:hypothetical protein